MQQERRRFLKLTGITGAGLLSGLEGLSGPFGWLPPDQQDFIYVQGIFPGVDSIQESGFHLRWVLPPSKGLPDQINIYRRGGDKSKSYGFQNDPRSCAEGGWKQIGVINNKVPGNLSDRISLQARNAFLRSISDRIRYQTLAPKYAALLAGLRNPDPRAFQVSGSNAALRIPFDELKYRNNRADMPDMSLSAHDLLVLNSLDPNIARMLGWYWVDTEEFLNTDIRDYKIEAVYENPFFRGKICGVFKGATTKAAPKPIFSDTPLVQQADRAYWEFTDQFQPLHFSRIRISWQQPAMITDPQAKATQLVAYLLAVGNEVPKLILPQQETDGTRLEYFYNRTPFTGAPVQIRIAGIDLFGQVSDWKTIPFTPREMMPPPAPVKLQFRDQPGGRIFLDFEYGAAQFLTDPDPSGFTIYQKKEKLYDGIFRFPFQQVIQEGQDETG